MGSPQRVRLTPPSRSERWLLPVLLTAAWLLAGATVSTLRDDVWRLAREGIGVFCPARAWYDHLAGSMVTGAAGVVLVGFALALWWSLRPLRRWERWVVALSAPAIALAVATMPLMQEVAQRGQARAMATFAVAMQPALEAMDRGALTEADCQAAAQRLVDALPRMTWSRRRATIAIALEPPDTGPTALVSATTLVVRMDSWWVAWDAESRAWVDKYTWHERLRRQGITR